MIDDYNMILFNVLWTSVPPVVVAVADQCVGDDTLMARPSLYKQGHRDEVCCVHL